MQERISLLDNNKIITFLVSFLPHLQFIVLLQHQAFLVVNHHVKIFLFANSHTRAWAWQRNITVRVVLLLLIFDLRRLDLDIFFAHHLQLIRSRIFYNLKQSTKTDHFK